MLVEMEQNWKLVPLELRKYTSGFQIFEQGGVHSNPTTHLKLNYLIWYLPIIESDINQLHNPEIEDGMIHDNVLILLLRFLF